MPWDTSSVFLVLVSFYSSTYFLVTNFTQRAFEAMGGYWRTSIDQSPPASPRFDLLHSPIQSGAPWPKVQPACLCAVRRNAAALLDAPSPGAQRINASFADDLELESERLSNLSPASTLSQWVQTWASAFALLFFLLFFFLWACWRMFPLILSNLSLTCTMCHVCVAIPDEGAYCSWLPGPRAPQLDTNTRLWVRHNCRVLQVRKQAKQMLRLIQWEFCLNGEAAMPSGGGTTRWQRDGSVSRVRWLHRRRIKSPVKFKSQQGGIFNRN